jgi:hypothetical protein
MSKKTEFKDRIEDVTAMTEGKYVNARTWVALTLLALEAKEAGLTHKDFFTTTEVYNE